MENQKNILTITDFVPRLPELKFTAPINWTVKSGEQWAIIGPNGSGKTLLADFLQHKHACREGEIAVGFDGNLSDQIKSIAFKDIYSLTDTRNTYYQQRWHSTETEDIPTVRELLGDPEGEMAQKIFAHFQIDATLSKRLIFLSSGELRKFLIVRTLLTHPRVLILDNPFIGLDADSRILLTDMLKQMTEMEGLQIILLLANPKDIPEFVTHILPLKNRHCYSPLSREKFLSDSVLINELFPENNDNSYSLPVDESKGVSSHQVTIRMEDIAIRYGERTILDGLNWEVKNNEKWALLGPNGSGKSTLLSLIYADNPQAYANTFYLFDRKRGSGESIWDIKKRIGYVSPEMHLYYQENVPAVRIVGSGFFDSVGLHRKCTPEQEVTALEWMRIFGVDHLKDRLFLTLSSGEQRLLLLARAFVKDPDLLILDEPLHGLDYANKQKVGRVIELFCERPGKTLIYVTHYQNELPSCVDKAFRLKSKK
ncbi:ATP-binding cassette domain-containing protein [Parabacteroides sp. OttesenSCG-928-G07]|nr:ATP-binding cassette domain-containing protein [Parabacteroides sp. OttesenSCG-928-G21]MDL2277795.1 ATP-binding cassette domain-containing protein [Parabacteroides sp. OttesenSCG-928-G07]